MPPEITPRPCVATTMSPLERRSNNISHGTFPMSSVAVCVHTVDIPFVFGVKYSPVDVATMSTDGFDAP